MTTPMCIFCGQAARYPRQSPMWCATCRLRYDSEIVAAAKLAKSRRLADNAKRLAARLGSEDDEHLTRLPAPEAATRPPKGRNLLLPDYKESLTAAYEQFVRDYGRRPTNAELAEALVVNKRTLERRIRDYRSHGGTWPPPQE